MISEEINKRLDFILCFAYNLIVEMDFDSLIDLELFMFRPYLINFFDHILK